MCGIFGCFLNRPLNEEDFALCRSGRDCSCATGALTAAGNGTIGGQGFIWGTPACLSWISPRRPISLWGWSIT